MVENFVISELEKRRKLGFIHSDQLYYYKSNAGKEVDVIIEEKEQLYAIEIKAIENPSRRDIANVRAYADQAGKSVYPILFYMGNTLEKLDGVHIVPIFYLFGASGFFQVNKN